MYSALYYLYLVINKIVMKYFIVVLLAIGIRLQAQNIISGPTVGGITATTARIFIKTNSPQAFQLEIAADENFSNPILFTDSTRSSLFASVITEVSGLQPFTRYYYQVKFNGVPDTATGSFKTFPAENDNSNYLKIAVGSCNYFLNSPLFQSIKDFEPDFFIHLGDWNYVPSVSGFGAEYNLFPDRRAAAFPEKYNDPMMKQYILPNMGIDYIYDDDYSQNDSEGDFYSNDFITLDSAGNVTTVIGLDTMPPGVNPGARLAYHQYFPGYAMADSSEGIFHSFKMGNAEIFMTDVRMPRTPRLNAFKYDSVANFWRFQPDTNHTILGQTQREWLINGLKNSTADWKIIGTGLVFNKNYRRFIDLGMLLQGLAVNVAGKQGSGVTLAYSLAVNWAGYPTDLNAVLKLKDEGVKNMIAISGDTHSSVIDDGTNAGIPELNASGLAAGDEAFLNYYIDSIVKTLGNQSVKDVLWNVGGNGVENMNFSDSYGTVEIFGEDSLRMCVVDELNDKLACVTVLKEIANTTETKVWKSNTAMNLIYPNPAKDVIHVLLNSTKTYDADDKIRLYNADGTLLQETQLNGSSEKPITINVSKYANGNYFIKYEGKYLNETKKIMLLK
jgi:hypothetical protein